MFSNMARSRGKADWDSVELYKDFFFFESRAKYKRGISIKSENKERVIFEIKDKYFLCYFSNVVQTNGLDPVVQHNRDLSEACGGQKLKVSFPGLTRAY